MEFRYGEGFDDAKVHDELVLRLSEKPWNPNVRIVASGKSKGDVDTLYHHDLDVSWLRTLFCEVLLDLKPDADWTL